MGLRNKQSSGQSPEDCLFLSVSEQSNFRETYNQDIFDRLVGDATNMLQAIRQFAGQGKFIILNKKGSTPYLKVAFKI